MAFSTLLTRVYYYLFLLAKTILALISHRSAVGKVAIYSGDLWQRRPRVLIYCSAEVLTRFVPTAGPIVSLYSFSALSLNRFYMHPSLFQSIYLSMKFYIESDLLNLNNLVPSKNGSGIEAFGLRRHI